MKMAPGVRAAVEHLEREKACPIGVLPPMSPDSPPYETGLNENVLGCENMKHMIY